MPATKKKSSSKKTSKAKASKTKTKSTAVRSTKAKTAKKPAAKKQAKKQLTGWDKYVHERESFYREHPNIQLLLALLIVATIVFMAMVYWQENTLVQYI